MQRTSAPQHVENAPHSEPVILRPAVLQHRRRVEVTVVVERGTWRGTSERQEDSDDEDAQYRGPDH